MRHLLVGALSTLVAACGIFGSTDSSTPPPDPTPQDNATPPPAAVGSEAPTGIFVSSSQGADDGTGSPVRPVKTLKRAFELARDQKARVIACAETYTENLELIDGVSAYGYYDCTKTPWERGTPKAVIKAPNSPAVIATGITQPTRIEGFEMRAPDMDAAPATDTTGSSIALEVRSSAALTISEALVHGGRGAPGTDGTDGPVNDRTAASDGQPAKDQALLAPCNPAIEICQPAPAIPGPPGGTTTCTIGPSGGPGGQAGDGRFWLSPTSESTAPAEFRGRPLVATMATAVGGINTSSDGFGKGLPGTRGADGAEGADGTDGAWSLSAMGFVRGNGTAGGPGGAGQGGGGGGGARGQFSSSGGGIFPTSGRFTTATGGGGGGGGCGGQPGTPGTGGGASIGAFVIDSSVTFEHAQIESSDGGRAGKGNLGSPAVPGGNGGLGTTHGVPTTGQGGDGGAGGNGGASGHGAPGPSIALAYSKVRPTTTGTVLAPGHGGAGQPLLSRAVGGTVGTKVLPAVVGVSEAEHQIQ